MPKFLNGKIINIQQEAESTRRFWVEIDADDIIPFKAGQFVTMELPIHEKRLKRMRSYSISSPPSLSNVLEFCIVKLNGGLATEYLFNEAQIGTELKFKYPAGVFTLPNPILKDLVFVCTGTGVAPFRSMILDIFNHEIPHKNIHLIFGTRTEDGILYKEEFEELEKKHPEFTYSVALSRDKNWKGHQGYVHQIYEQYYSDVDENRAFYLCGWSMMVDEAVERLERLGYDKNQIIFELYG